MSNPTRADMILRAQQAGYRVEESKEDYGGWLVITPSAPRRPSQTLGAYKTAERAWMGAALLASQDD
jgi:hypothetical protein